jgi:hypothetical protein
VRYKVRCHQNLSRSANRMKIHRTLYRTATTFEIASTWVIPTWAFEAGANKSAASQRTVKTIAMFQDMVIVVDLNQVYPSMTNVGQPSFFGSTMLRFLSGGQGRTLGMPYRKQHVIINFASVSPQRGGGGFSTARIVHSLFNR